MKKAWLGFEINRYHIKIKQYALLLLFAVIFLPLFLYHPVYSQGVIGTVKTPLEVTVDQKIERFKTNQAYVAGALESRGIFLNKNDITEPTPDTLLTGQKTKISVTRALPVLVSDNGQEFMAESAYTDPNKILEQLKVTIYPEDRVRADLITDPADEQAIGQKITIERAPIYTIHVDGQDLSIRSWGKTIAEVLNGKVSLGLRDTVEPDLKTTAQGGEITVTRINVVETVETVTVQFQTETKKDYSMYRGDTKLLQQGENGQKKESVRITYHNGQIVSRVVLSSEILKPVVTKIVSEGVKPYNAGMWWDILVAASQKYGVDPVAMFKVMTCESGGNKYSGKGSNNQGLFQWDSSFYSWAARAGYPNANIFDPNAQIYATAYRVSLNGWSAWGCKP